MSLRSPILTKIVVEAERKIFIANKIDKLEEI